MKNDRSGGPAGMMNPRISTSLPPYDLIVWVTSESARIESTSWAKVRRGTTSDSANRTAGSSAVNRQAAIRVRNGLILGQRCKVFRDLCAIGEQRRQQASQRAEQDEIGRAHV